MKNRGPILILIALILVIIGYVLMRNQAIAPTPEEEAATTMQATAHTFSWRFQTDESNDGLAPRSKVALIADGNAYDTGAYAGSCAEIASENLLENEVSAVLCWYAGGGDEIGVFKEGDRYVLKHGFQEESTAESDGFRGDFTQIAEIK